MRITILSKRAHEHWPSWDLVYEWEDVISDKLGVCLREEPLFLRNKYLRRLLFYFKSLLFAKGDKYFFFEMNPVLKRRITNVRAVVPCIIDYYLTDGQLADFEKAYSKNQAVCVSSKEVYNHLLSREVKLPIVHLPLSISDKYAVTENTVFEKEYDMVLMGRQNPVLEKFLNKYIEEHPNFNYVYRKQEGGKFLYYTSSGDLLGDIVKRDDYIALMRKAKCALYATPGIDGGEKRTNGFSQVTPRFLELLAAGCHVIARYKQNDDTEFYRLQDFCESVDTYEDFERLVDYALTTPVDMRKYARYLEGHYTSNRAKQLRLVL